MSQDVPIYIGPDAVPELVAFCQRLPAQPFTLVSDTNTYRALGQRIEAALIQAGLPVLSLVLEGDEVIADEKRLIEVMVKTPPFDQVFVAIGSGTITDIARYVSFRTRNPFISAPTAASVDGFLSTGAPLVVGGVKDTFKAQGPIGVFADLPTLMDAPPELRAAGFGDVIGKTTALADWRLGHCCGASRTIRHRSPGWGAMASCCSGDDIASGSEAGIRYPFDALIETGLACWTSGFRGQRRIGHHCSYNWEMQPENRGHSAKVGYVDAIAQLYDNPRPESDDAGSWPPTPCFRPRGRIADIQRYGSGADAVRKIRAVPGADRGLPAVAAAHRRTGRPSARSRTRCCPPRRWRRCSTRWAGQPTGARWAWKSTWSSRRCCTGTISATGSP